MVNALKRLVNRAAGVRVDNGRYSEFYGSVAARNAARSEAKREVDMAMHLLSFRR